MAKYYIYRISGSTVPWTCVDIENSIKADLTIDDFGDIIFSVDDIILGYQATMGTINYVFVITNVSYSSTADSVTLTLRETFLQSDGVTFDISTLSSIGTSDVCEIDVETYNEIVSQFGVAGVSVTATASPGSWYQRIYMGAPGTGKTTEANEFALNKIKASSTDIIRTTFHPATDYASFVGCYKPESYLDPADSTGSSYLIKYEYCAQPFIQAYCKAWNYKNSGQNLPVVLIIEEINRANCAQAFGDIFQLLDRAPGSAITPEKSLFDFLNRECKCSLDAKGKMNLPDNLSILATMNTSDQSLFPIDSAFLRRWERIYVRIDYTGVTPEKHTPTIDATAPNKSANLIMTFGKKSYKWIDFLHRVNEKIGKVQMDEKKMGNYAVKRNIDTRQFIGSVLSYLWDSVCKDLDVEDDSYFMRLGETDTPSFSFWDVIESDEPRQESLLQGFMDYLAVQEITVTAPPSTSGSASTAGASSPVPPTSATTFSASTSTTTPPAAGTSPTI